MFEKLILVIKGATGLQNTQNRFMKLQKVFVIVHRSVNRIFWI